MKLNSAYLNPFGMIKGPEIFCSLVSWSLAAEMATRVTDVGNKEEIMFLLIVSPIAWLFVTVWFFVNIFMKKIRCGRAAYIILGVVHLLIGVVVLVAGVLVVVADRRYCGYERWRNPYCQHDDNIYVAGVFGVITAIILIIDSFVHFYERNREVNDISEQITHTFSTFEL